MTAQAEMGQAMAGSAPTRSLAGPGGSVGDERALESRDAVTRRFRGGGLGSGIGGWLKRLLLSEYFVLYLTIAYFLALLPFLPSLANPANLANTLSNVWPLLAVAIGQTFVLTIGGIDLSQGAVVGLTSVIGAMLLATVGAPEVLSGAPIWGVFIGEQGGALASHAYGMLFAILAMMLVASLIGLFNGVAVAYFQMPPFMVTLVTLIVVGAFAIFITHSENIRNLPESYVALGKDSVISLYIGEAAEPQVSRRQLHPFVTYAMIISVALAVAAHVLLSRTVFGRQVYAIGTNRKAATISGVPVKRVIVLVFIVSSLCAMIGGLLYSARLEAGRPTLGEGTFLLDVIGATVIGGTSLFGGKAKILWTFFGVLFFVLLSNTLNLMNLSSFVIDMVKGAVIVSAALLDVTRTRFLAGTR